MKLHNLCYKLLLKCYHRCQEKYSYSNTIKRLHSCSSIWMHGSVCGSGWGLFSLLWLVNLIFLTMFSIWTHRGAYSCQIQFGEAEMDWRRNTSQIFLCRLVEEFLLLAKTCPEFVQQCLYGSKPWHFERGTEEKCTLHVDSLFQNGFLKNCDLFNIKTFRPWWNFLKKLKCMFCPKFEENSNQYLPKPWSLVGGHVMCCYACYSTVVIAFEIWRRRKGHVNKQTLLQPS